MATRAELAANPEATNAEVEAVMADDIKKPEIAPPPADTVSLPGGLVFQGQVYRTVRVQELKGAHEEALARAIQPPPGKLQTNWANFISVLLECGTVQFGDLDENPKELLKDTLIGDRDAIILGIRQATYGDEVELKDWQCPSCGGRADLTISLSNDVDVVALDDPINNRTFDVRLRHGRSATVRLATGRVLAAMWEGDLNAAERKSIMLTHCLMKITEKDGTATRVAGRSGGIVMDMSVPDRESIVSELEKRQPGPRYNSVKFVHQDCRKEVPLAIDLGDLFPDLF